MAMAALMLALVKYRIAGCAPSYAVHSAVARFNPAGVFKLFPPWLQAARCRTVDPYKHSNLMETTIVFWGYIGIMPNRMEATIVYWGCIGIPAEIACPAS